jgi:hypothetical protein
MYSAAVFGVSAWTIWVMVRSVEQTMMMATAMRVRLDDRIEFNFNDLMRTESMLPEEQARMLAYPWKN